MSGAAPSAEQVHAALDEILGWQGVARSPQIGELLRYVVEKTLAGDGPSIKAYSIAVDVLGRPQSFDPQSDPIVRVQARRLRMLLEQFYESGRSQTDVRIDLPLGRYVPEFRVVPRTDSSAAGPDHGHLTGTEQVAAAQTPRRSRFVLNAFLGLCFTLIGVAIAVALVRWTAPLIAPTAPGPVAPEISVGGFDNLTGEPVLDDDVDNVGKKLASALAKFDQIKVTPTGAPLVIRGTVQEDNGQFSIKALLVQGSGILWSGTFVAPLGHTDTEALASAVQALAAQLGNASGPLFASGRAWLKQQSAAPVSPTLFICQLEYMQWRDSREPADADMASACFDTILAAVPDTAPALAASAGVNAWKQSFQANPGSDLASLLASETLKVARAVSLAPNDSFVYEQQGLVLGRQGSLDAALGAIAKAIELNPADMDALAVGGIVHWLNGEFDLGNGYSEKSITALASPPPWYYMTRAFETMRQKRYFDALEAGLALSIGDQEFGPVIVLAAAQRAGRIALVDRYRPLVMNNPRFQQSGILPRLALLIKPAELMDRIREGLTVVGIPPNALTGPFNPDGTPRLK